MKQTIHFTNRKTSNNVFASLSTNTNNRKLCRRFSQQQTWLTRREITLHHSNPLPLRYTCRRSSVLRWGPWGSWEGCCPASPAGEWDVPLCLCYCKEQCYCKKQRRPRHCHFLHCATADWWQRGPQSQQTLLPPPAVVALGQRYNALHCMAGHPEWHWWAGRGLLLSCDRIIVSK